VAALAFRRLLSGDSHVVVQKLWREIGPIGPHESVKLGVDREPPEIILVAQRFEYRATQSRPKIDFAGGSVPKPQPHDVPTDVPRFQNVIVHLSLQRGNALKWLSLASEPPIL
jgi:hypothetical protein